MDQKHSYMSLSVSQDYILMVMPNSEVIHNKNLLYTEYVLQDYENTTQSQQFYIRVTVHHNK